MSPRLFANPLLRCGGTLLLWALTALPLAHAQKQETGILSKVKAGGSGNSESFAFEGANKSFGTASAAGGKTAQVKAYSFGGKSSVFGGDGTFRTKNFANSKGEGFRTEAYGVKASTLSQRNSFAQSDKGFETKSLDVREAPAANKSAVVRDYQPANKAYYGRGKRQDMLDDRTQSAKNLTVDQVRDLLNKGPEAKPGTILEPVLPSVR